MNKKQTTNKDNLRKRAVELKLYGLLSFFDEIADESWVERLLDAEELERQRRSLERRQANARIGPFRPMADFDWAWPTHIDRDIVEDLFQLQFLEESANVIVRGANGLGKTMIAQNLAYQAVLAGHTVRFVSASEMLNDLAAKDSTASLHRRLQRYCRPRLLAIDELGYLAYDDRHADLLFEVVSRRYGKKSTLITTNKPFSEWSEVFPNSSCVVALVDRLIHRAEVIRIEGESYRLKEAKEREDKRSKARPRKRSRK
jgi:DNA replication protein DnaC